LPRKSILKKSSVFAPYDDREVHVTSFERNENRILLLPCWLFWHFSFLIKFTSSRFFNK
jgi:hypothetical protein